MTTVDPIGRWPSNGLERIKNCPVCDGRDRFTLYDGLSDNVFFSAPGRWCIQSCKTCKSAYIDPRPNRETIGLAYDNYYTHGATPRILSEDLNSVRRLVRNLSDGYRNKRFGGERSSANRFGWFLFRLLPYFRYSLDSQLRHIPKSWEGARMLDVGCGSGAFLENVVESNWEAIGVDVDFKAVEAARLRGLTVLHGDIDAIVDNYGGFDLITISHVIEHVHDPRHLLKVAYSLLVPGGKLYVDTPNIESWGHRKFGRYWRGLEVPRHLAIFSWDSLENLLSEVGFSMIRRLYRKRTYASMAAKSRALKRGVSPYNCEGPQPLDRILSLLLDLWAKKSVKRSEFVTIVAVK